MAIIPCPCCTGMISDKAIKCVHCGYRIGSCKNSVQIRLSPAGKSFILKHTGALLVIMALAAIGGIFFTPLLGVLVAGTLLKSWCREAGGDLRNIDFKKRSI